MSTCMQHYSLYKGEKDKNEGWVTHGGKGHMDIAAPKP